MPRSRPDTGQDHEPDAGTPDAGPDDGRGAPRLEATTDAVLVASRALVGVAARSLTTIEAKITLPQYRALVVLASQGEQTVGGLADALEVHPSTATRLCDRLLGKHLIARTTSTESRREVNVALSPTGEALVRMVTARRRDEIRKIVAELPADVQRALITAFETFARAAGELPDEAWRLGWTA